ncbi:MAG: thioredoxin [Saprospiraceae bacterium]|nr:thioredoxin [Saprospiraceae bacterium]
MDFHKDVITRSKQIPVVVDFWAPWCGPCRVLGPVIEQLASEQHGSWELVKVNTEEHQEVAMEYAIRSIPNVKLFINGKVASEFAGALPRHQILQWLDENIPSPEKEAWTTVLEKIETVTESQASEILSSFLDDHPEHAEARLELAKKLVFSDPARAMKLVADIKMGQAGFDVVEDINNLMELSELSGQANGLEGELSLSAKEMQTGNLEGSVERLIEVVRQDKSIHKELPRRAAIAIFRLLGNHHPITKKYRRLFDMVLY